MTPHSLSLTHIRQSTAQGFVFVMTLVILVAMTLIGIAVVRSSDASALVSTALGFRHAVSSASDSSIETAITWLTNNNSLLTADCASAGYYASEMSGTTIPSDYTGTSTPSNSTDNVNWSRTGFSLSGWTPSDNGSSAKCTPVGTGNSTRLASDPVSDTAGNQSSYIIQRLCTSTGIVSASSGNVCATGQTTTLSGASSGAVSYGSYSVGGATQLYYRITIRTVGARNTVSYTQAKVLLNY